MVSEVAGQVRILVWVEDGDVKALVDDNGRVPVTIGEITVTPDVNIASSDIDVPVSIDAASIDVPISIDAATVTVPVAEQSPLTSIQAQVYGWDTSNWRKNPIMWGFTERYYENLDQVAGAVNVTVSSTNVPAGYVYVIQNVSARNITTANTTVVMYTRDSGTQVTFIHYQTGLAAYQPAMFNGEIVLEAGDSISINMVVPLATDNIQVRLWGYKMKVNE